MFPLEALHRILGIPSKESIHIEGEPFFVQLSLKPLHFTS
jgi:hypothetical protein